MKVILPSLGPIGDGYDFYYYFIEGNPPPCYFFGMPIGNCLLRA